MIWTSSAGKISSNRRRASHKTRGFTLLEVIMVVTFIGLIAALSLPIAMDVLERTKQNTSIRKVASTLRTARGQAIAFKVPFTFKGDMETGQYWLTNVVTEEDSKIFQLARELRFSAFHKNRDQHREGTFTVIFYPQGTTSGGTILFQPQGSGKTDSQYTITIDPVTGKPRVRHDEK